MLWTSCMLFDMSHVFCAVLLPAMATYGSTTTVYAQVKRRKLLCFFQVSDIVRSKAKRKTSIQLRTPWHWIIPIHAVAITGGVCAHFTYICMYGYITIVTLKQNHICINVIQPDAVSSVFSSVKSTTTPLEEERWFSLESTSTNRWGHTAT